MKRVSRKSALAYTDEFIRKELGRTNYNRFIRKVNKAVRLVLQAPVLALYMPERVRRVGDAPTIDVYIVAAMTLREIQHSFAESSFHCWSKTARLHALANLILLHEAAGSWDFTVSDESLQFAKQHLNDFPLATLPYLEQIALLGNDDEFTYESSPTNRFTDF